MSRLFISDGEPHLRSGWSRWLRLSLLSALGTLLCHAQEQSAAALIQGLITPRVDVAAGAFLLTCSSTGTDAEEGRNDRKAAESLVKLGPSAVPDIERELDSIERHAHPGLNASLLLHAYARIRRSDAFPRLRALEENPELLSFSHILGDSIALSLGLTGYISNSSPITQVFYCRSPVPRDALNQFILAWENDDMNWLWTHLGPNARAALSSLLDGRNWRLMRSDLWRGRFPRLVAVGYRFDVSGRWADPEDILDEAVDPEQGFALYPVPPVNPEIETLFKNRVGGDCGRHKIQFKGDGRGRDEYIVDDSDLEGLFRLIAVCATDGGR